MGSLDENLDALLAPAPDGSKAEPSSAPRPRVKHPSGFEPGHRWDGREGYIVPPPVAEEDTGLAAPESDTWARVMRELKLDPTEVEIVGDPEVRTWDMAIGEGRVHRMWYYKARIRRIRADVLDYDDLVAEIRAWKPARRKRSPRNGAWLIVNLADWQVGCGDGDGTRGTIGRVLHLAVQVERHVADLQRRGYRLAGMTVAGLGDLVEGCSGWYPNQQATVDLDQRSQHKVVRRLIVRLLKAWADLVPEIVVTAVGGNHGENRLGSRANKGGAMGDADNSDVGVFEVVAEVLAENPTLARRFRWHLPTDELVVHLELGPTGYVGAWSHGHLSPGGKAPLSHWSWWTEKIKGDHRGLIDASLLTVGHFHHFIVYQPNASRMVVQTPAMDGGSKHFRDRAGATSRPGTVVQVITDGGPQVPEVLDAVPDYRAADGAYGELAGAPAQEDAA